MRYQIYEIGNFHSKSIDIQWFIIRMSIVTKCPMCHGYALLGRILPSLMKILNFSMELEHLLIIYLLLVDLRDDMDNSRDQWQVITDVLLVN